MIELQGDGLQADALPKDWLVPDWPAPPAVRAFSTTRHGGVSVAPFASLNLGDHVGDEAAAVAQNRALVRRFTPAVPHWLQQVHGVEVVTLAGAPQGVPAADASVSRTPHTVCAMMTADCLPLLFCDQAGRVVGAAHAGWRGLCQGVIEATVTAMQVPPATVMAWLGPAIGPTAFEVGEEVRTAFVGHDAAAARAFTEQGMGKWRADIYALAKQRLWAMGVTQIYGGDACTFTDAARFFSYRREGVTGRMASLIWLA